MNKKDHIKYRKNLIKKTINCRDDSIKNKITNLMIRSIWVIVILITVTIIYKKNGNFKDVISNYFFKEEISFTKINKLYDKYLGGFLLIKKEQNNVDVFNEKLNYSESSIYYDGVRLSVSENYLVPNIDEGMVVFVGNKDNYGKTVIIENLDGIFFWYGNINNTSLKLYDYVEKGSFIGETNNYLYMVFSKDGKFLSYEDYI